MRLDKTLGAIFALLVLSRLPCAAFAAEVPSDEAVERATKQLGARSFAERQQASEFLWSAGPRAEARLREAAAGRDPEVRLRARAILERFRYGILTDTPAETVDLINRFRFGDGNARREAMRLLVERGAVRRDSGVGRGGRGRRVAARVARALGSGR